MTRAVPDIACALVRQKEGLKLTVSADVAGTLDAGYGHTGPELKAGDKITRRQADLWLKEDLATAAKRLARVVKPEVIADLTDHQYAALLSFVFNVGCQPGWAIWKVLNARDYDRVPAQLLRFVNAGGKKVQGLVNRRTAEVALWSTDEPGSVPDLPSSAVTRSVETPPTPAAPVDKKPLVASALGFTALAAPAVNQAREAVAPYADQSPLIGQALGILATLGGLIAFAAVVLVWLQHRNASR